MLYTVKQAYEKLNRTIGINQVRVMMASGEIPAVLKQGKWITTDEHIKLFEQSINQQAKQEAELMQNIHASAKYR